MIRGAYIARMFRWGGGQAIEVAKPFVTLCSWGALAPSPPPLPDPLPFSHPLWEFGGYIFLFSKSWGGGQIRPSFVKHSAAFIHFSFTFSFIFKFYSIFTRCIYHVVSMWQFFCCLIVNFTCMKNHSMTNMSLMKAEAFFTIICLIILYTFGIISLA